MTWLLHLTKQDDDGKWMVRGKPFRTQEDAEAAGERLKNEDPAIRDYKVTEAR